MTSLKKFRRTRRAGTSRRAAAMCAALALVLNSFLGLTAGAQQQAARVQSQAAAKRLTEEQRIIHVLNRLGFGARPGDVERVRRMGVERYIEQQLHPSSINDEAAEARLRNLPTLTMSSAELLAKYPNPGMLLRQLQRRGELPAELAALRDAGQKANGTAPDSAAAQPSARTGEMNAPLAEGREAEATKGGKGAQMTGRDGDAAMSADGEGAKGDGDMEKRQRRRAMLEYMRANGLQPPQRVTAELQAARILRAVYSERQLQEVMVDFWTNHFNVFVGKGADRWLLTSYDRDVIRPNALGRFRQLLGATAKSPAMLFYLDNFQSVSPNAPRRRPLRLMELFGGPGAGRRAMDEKGDADVRPLRQRQMNARRQAEAGARAEGEMAQPQDEMARRPQQQQKRARRGINENYARELMELHTLGVEGGYTQKDVQEVARCFTGWTILNPRGYAGGPDAATFVFNPRLHDDGEKVVLGHKIAAGGGQRDGEMVLDILARHPSTAKFIATKLARRFVTDNPSPALVERVAAAFTKSDGDIAETLRALFASPEFNSAEARRAKIKTPFELAASAIRTLGGETNGGPALQQWIARMGEPLYGYQAPTGYPDTAEYWVNTGALLERLNFALALVSNRVPGTRVDLSRFAGEAATSSRAVDQNHVVDQFLNIILQGDVSPKTRATLMKQLTDQTDAPIALDAAAANDAPARREGRGARRRNQMESLTVGNPEVARIAALILGSPEFQRQ